MIYTIGNAKDNVRFNGTRDFIEELGEGSDCGQEQLYVPLTDCDSTL